MSVIAPVTDWTEERVLGLLRAEHDRPVDAATWIGSGHWSDCFAFTVGDSDFVIRIGRHVEDFRKDAFVARLARPGLPIPAVSRVGQAGGEWFAISERVYGEPLELVEPWSQVTSSTVDLLEALRSADLNHTAGWGRWNEAGIAPWPSWRDFLLDVDQDLPDSRVHGWRKKLAGVPEAERVFAKGYERLRLVASDEVPRSIVHNDLINRNTHACDGRVVGVFDWGMSLFGDHLYDLGLFVFWQPWLSNLRHHDLLRELRDRWATPGNEVANFATRFDTCLLHIGLEHIAYGAHLGNWANVEAICARIDAVRQTNW